MERDFIGVETRHFKSCQQQIKWEKWNWKDTIKSGDTQGEEETRQ